MKTNQMLNLVETQFKYNTRTEANVNFGAALLRAFNN